MNLRNELPSMNVEISHCSLFRVEEMPQYVFMNCWRETADMMTFVPKSDFVLPALAFSFPIAAFLATFAIANAAILYFMNKKELVNV